jgi:hypothetical protein
MTKVVAPAKSKALLHAASILPLQIGGYAAVTIKKIQCLDLERREKERRLL